MYGTRYKPTPIDRYLGLTHQSLIKKANKLEIDAQCYKEAKVSFAPFTHPSSSKKIAQQLNLGKAFIDSLEDKPELNNDVIKRIIKTSKKLVE